MVELADHQHCIGADAFAQNRAAPGDASGRFDNHRVAVADAETAPGRPVDDHALVAGDVVGDLVDQRDPDIGAPRILHRARGERPERVGVRVLAYLAGVIRPYVGKGLVARQRLVLLELAVPPVDADLVQPLGELRPVAHQPLLVGHLEAETLLLQRRVEIPVELRERPQHEAVLPEPVDAVHLGAVRERVARGLRDRVPDLFHRMRPRHVEAEIVTRLVVGEPRAGSAPVDRRVVGFEDADPPGEFGRNFCDVPAIDHRVGDRLAHRPALVLPELLGELGRTDLDQLQALKVGRLGQQDVGHVVGLVPRIGEGDGERELRDPFGDLGRVPRRDRRVGAVVDPHRGLGLLGPAFRRLLLEQPGQMRRPKRGRPGRVGGERHQGLVRVADMRLGRPLVPRRRVERVVHDPVALRPDGEVTVIGRPVELDRGPERPARHFEGADQRREQGARPAGLVAAPAVVDPLPQHHRDGAERERLPFDLYGLAHHRVGQVFVGDAADALGRNVALGFRPFRREVAHMIEEELEGGPRLGLFVRPDRAVRTHLDA